MARESLLLAWLDSSMAGSRKWFVESKDFELLIKGGLSGVRIIEKL